MPCGGEIANTERELTKLNERIAMWEQYEENKGVYQQLAALKPGAREFLLRKAPCRADTV